MASLKHHHEATGQEHKGFFTRLFESIAESRLRYAEHQIGRYSDEIERLKHLQDEKTKSAAELEPKRHH
jgi:hypothetical protein